ncbi:uncharacterized protein MONOS_4556 [Monocercomonoides exilis]|uniref:uncharacterized protein n=1 Tax=Monocercomonoides exilis TaxID=2049356 RepID=UPI00355A0F41|nr:hypothetical protein MONOS_4556 [Monocercomonoides exilis]|eukprot:MONOS_4556.1-p1 / transcript=MONOS_4556.1 / gene=MONOS_4556 / organism=Monocercomonoides_exilis_PA203 / gene_product=unspecified product / transcript_product=unspecified product / location=Mono_scaffold00122:61813-62811(+) / protein_length=226 / sequence_SO=supercontig / SO=protein_coding / is_pseudo=false
MCRLTICALIQKNPAVEVDANCRWADFGCAGRDEHAAFEKPAGCTCEMAEILLRLNDEEVFGSGVFGDLGSTCDKECDEACACVWSSVCGALDTETQLTGLEEVRQAEVQTAKEQESFNALDKKLGAEEEFIQRRQSNDMCRSINEVAILRGPLQIVRAFSAAAQMGVPMLLKMVAEKVYYAFISSSSAALSSACANISFSGIKEEITHVAKFQEVKHSKKLIEK